MLGQIERYAILRNDDLDIRRMHDQLGRLAVYTAFARKQLPEPEKGGDRRENNRKLAGRVIRLFDELGLQCEPGSEACSTGCFHSRSLRPGSDLT